MMIPVMISSAESRHGIGPFANPSYTVDDSAAEYHTILWNIIDVYTVYIYIHMEREIYRYDLK